MCFFFHNHCHYLSFFILSFRSLLYLSFLFHYFCFSFTFLGIYIFSSLHFFLFCPYSFSVLIFSLFPFREVLYFLLYHSFMFSLSPPFLSTSLAFFLIFPLYDFIFCIFPFSITFFFSYISITHFLFLYKIQKSFHEIIISFRHIYLIYSFADSVKVGKLT